MSWWDVGWCWLLGHGCCWRLTLLTVLAVGCCWFGSLCWTINLGGQDGGRRCPFWVCLLDWERQRKNVDKNEWWCVIVSRSEYWAATAQALSGRNVCSQDICGTGAKAACFSLAPTSRAPAALGARTNKHALAEDGELACSHLCSSQPTFNSLARAKLTSCQTDIPTHQRISNQSRATKGLNPSIQLQVTE